MFFVAGKSVLGRLVLVSFFISTYVVSGTDSFRYIDEKGCVKGALAEIMDQLKVDLSQYKDVSEQKKSLKYEIRKPLVLPVRLEKL